MTSCAVCGTPTDPDTAHDMHDPWCPKHRDPEFWEDCYCTTKPVCPGCCPTCREAS